MKLKGFTLMITALGALLGTAPAVLADTTIGINFTGGAHTLAPSAQPGIVAGANWNNIYGPWGNSMALNESSGLPSTAQLTFSAGQNYDFFSTTNFVNPDTNTLYGGGLCCLTSIISVTNIPYSSYKVYVYASEDTYALNTLSITDGHTTFYYAGDGRLMSAAPSLLLTTSTNSLSPTVGPAQYQVFEETGSSFTLTTGGAITYTLSNNVFGIQIVPNPVPTNSVPTNKDQCKDGGWQSLVRSNGASFKNQGDCIQYVNTGK